MSVRSRVLQFHGEDMGGLLRELSGAGSRVVKLLKASPTASASPLVVSSVGSYRDVASRYVSRCCVSRSLRLQLHVLTMSMELYSMDLDVSTRSFMVTQVMPAATSSLPGGSLLLHCGSTSVLLYASFPLLVFLLFSSSISSSLPALLCLVSFYYSRLLLPLPPLQHTQSST